MRRNVVPLRASSNKPTVTQRSIISHINQIGSMLNAPSRMNPINRVARQPYPNLSPNLETQSDDDYLDDYIYDQNTDSQSNDDDQEYIRDALIKSNSERGATLAEIDSLPQATVANKIEGVCAICLQQWKQKDKYTILPCTHKFHCQCIKGWLQQKNKCPCCNLVVF